MIRINVEGRTATNLRNAVRDMDQRMAELLQEVGVSVLSNARLDFETKSRGGSGAGGITWAPLKPSTEAKKARRGRKPGKTKKGKTRKRDRVTGSHARTSQIGVDTGMLRNSAGPGFQGPDGKGGNILEVNQHQVTVGYGRTYAQYFDEGGRGPARPLLPDPVPDEWLKEIDAIVSDWTDDVFGKVE